MAYVSNTKTFNISFWEKLKNTSAKMLERAQQRMIYRTTLTELNGLSERELADLGISRTAIKSIATEAAYGK